ncbi:24392_t:CDS:2 [Gigaspora margarita]|uniref:24392_t:CDS:1 n=1 Tax=Gigaspora margarita TaxID=4874 RepID=A0ABM8VW78_GIGMA|nr:24392_t:CDS:2 [Gigaspora margarita]
MSQNSKKKLNEIFLGKKKANTKAHGDYLPTNKEIDEIIESCIPENTHKATKKWVTALNSGEHSQMKIIQFTFFDDGGIQFTKFSQKNDPGSIEGNLDSLIIPVLADLKKYKCGKWYLNTKLGQNSCSNFMKSICSEVGINIKDYALSTLINVVDLPESQNDGGAKDFLNKNRD